MSRYECPECAYQYDEAKGDAFLGYPPGTGWEALPEDFVCPDCAVTGKDGFIKLAAED